MIGKRLRFAPATIAFFAAAGAGCGSEPGSEQAFAVGEGLTAATSLTACGEITKAGAYALDADLTGGNGSVCIGIHDTSKVTLDCQHHTIHAMVAIEVSNVDTFTIENCNLQPEGNASLFDIASSRNGTITNNVIGQDASPPAAISPHVDIAHSSQLTIESNTIYMNTQISYSSGLLVSGNTLKCAIADCNALLFVQFGSSNRFVDNTIDGEAAVQAPLRSPGSDDGVVLWDETSDEVESNTIKNVWDCGIEAYGEVTSSTLSKNTITNASNCGIGGWYYLSLRSCTVSNNKVNGSAKMFDFYRVHGLRPAGYKGPGSPAETGVYFTNNTFSGNSFTNSYGGGYSSHIPFQNAGKLLDYDGMTEPSDPGEVAPTRSQFHLANNKFQKNNFDGKSGQVAYFGEPAVKGAVVDKGGNVCSKTPFKDYPLSCGRP